jgi:predicted nucleotidyltransferase
VEVLFKKEESNFMKTKKTIIKNVDEIIRKLNEYREKLRELNVKKIGIFGSYVRNKQKIGSDLDFIIEFFDNNNIFDNYMDLLYFLEDLFNLKVDLVFEDCIKERLKPKILNDVIYVEGI